MTFLFIYPSPGVLGGIETLISRMTHWLLKHGHTVSVLTERDDHWSGTLPHEVRCIALGEKFRELYYYHHAKSIWSSLGLSKPDVIKGFDLPSSWIACELATMLGHDCKVIAGMYASFLFKWYYAPRALKPFDSTKLFLGNYLECIPANARLVCGIDQVEELELTHGEKCILWPIPIDPACFAPASRKPKWGKIVSVGRLCAMKEYNFYMIDVVRELRERGHAVTWTVYGGGEYEAEMRRRIQAAGLGDVISMEGSIPYRQLWQALSDAHVFVGMGTSMLEAAYFKVPNVYAVAYDRVGLTYGPLYNAPLGSIGPGLARAPTMKVSDEIERILRLSPEAYQTEEESNYRHVQHNEIGTSMNRFLQLVREAGPVRKSKFRYLLNYPRWIADRFSAGLSAEKMTAHPDAPFYGTATTS